jgi:3-methyladenine DNA glycosylase AlkD
MLSIMRVRKEIRNQQDVRKAQFLQRFFKTGRGQYGEHDAFLGLTVPQSRMLANKFQDMSLPAVFALLESKYHEERLIALFILIALYNRGEPSQKNQIVIGYIKRVKSFVNNWDLVDTSAHQILGRHLYDNKLSTSRLERLARSKNLWERRVAVISTMYFIRQGELALTLKISQILLNDGEDLIHKAVGWMLREVGKKSRPTLDKFLYRNAANMPRTMLRYAIEKHAPLERSRFMKRK